MRIALICSLFSWTVPNLGCLIRFCLQQHIDEISLFIFHSLLNWDHGVQSPASRNQGGKCRDISVIYRRYIVYREGSTRYFVEKNRRRDISINIAKISMIYRLGEIYRRLFEKIASGSKISAKYRWYIGNKSSIFWRYFPSFMQCDLTAQITLLLIRRPRCDFNGNMAIQRPYCSQFFI